MRFPCLLLLAVLLAGCERNHVERERQRAALDVLISSGVVSRVEFVDRQHDKTNVFAGAKALPVLALLNATNRIDKPPPDTKHYSDWIFLFRNEMPIRMEYYPRQQVLSFRGYRFGLKGTNDILRLFE